MNTQEVLQQCKVEGNIVKLPDVKLDRVEYTAVKNALQKIGGSWKGGKVQGFVFPSDPTDLLSDLQGGAKRNIKKEFQFFGTPSALARQLVELANIKNYSRVLEPSAGQGAIIEQINLAGFTPYCYELMEQNRDVLNKSGLSFNLIGEDFLKHSQGEYEAIIANPPFSKNQDIDHVKHMYDFLSDSGTLVSVMSNSWANGSQKKQIEFKHWLETVNAEIIDLPQGTFKESGTNVGGKIVVIRK